MCMLPEGQWRCPPLPGNQKAAHLASLQPECRWKGPASLLEHHPRPKSSPVPAEDAATSHAAQPCKLVVQCCHTLCAPAASTLVRRVCTTKRLCMQQPAQSILYVDLTIDPNSVHDIRLLAMLAPSALMKLTYSIQTWADSVVICRDNDSG